MTKKELIAARGFRWGNELILDLGLGTSAGAKIPSAYSGEHVLDGLTYRVKPAGHKPGSRRAHRVFVVCVCGTEVPAGRIRQHRCPAP